MSHPVPSHDPENEREEDSEFAPRKSIKGRALASKKKSKKSRFDAMIHPEKAHPSSPLGRLHGLLNK